MKSKTEYAIYKGDQFLFVGTKKECAEFLGVKKDTIGFYTRPIYRQRAGASYNRIMVYKLEEDLDETQPIHL